jgi:hypothetical protein
MKKDEMITLLRSVSCDENTVTAMTNAYDMGFEYGSKAYVHLTDAVESARDVCKYVDHDHIEDAKAHTQFFWEHLDKLKDLE